MFPNRSKCRQRMDNVADRTQFYYEDPQTL
jgi:hypothetical protein